VTELAEKRKRRRWRCSNCGARIHKTGYSDEPPPGWVLRVVRERRSITCAACVEELTR